MGLVVPIPNLPPTVVLPDTPNVLPNVVAPVTVNVLLNVAAPVTSSVPPISELSEALNVPFTCNFLPGSVVPIPTLPACAINILVVLLGATPVLKNILLVGVVIYISAPIEIEAGLLATLVLLKTPYPWAFL